MYEGLHFVFFSKYEEKKEKEKHREKQLNEHPDVLFRIYCQSHLHVLLFRPTDDGWWIHKLKNEYRGISAQWTFKHAVNKPIRHVMNLSGNRKELQRFCDDFPGNLRACNAHVQETEDLRAEMEDLKEKVQKLILKNKNLKQMYKES